MFGSCWLVSLSVRLITLKIMAGIATFTKGTIDEIIKLKLRMIRITILHALVVNTILTFLYLVYERLLYDVIVSQLYFTRPTKFINEWNRLNRYE